jgi:hypothetical protein
MTRPYGKTPRGKKRQWFKSKTSGSGFKFTLRREDSTPLSIADIRQGLLDIVRELAPYENCRARRAAFYLTLIDEQGSEILIHPSGEKTLYPYQSAADELGL